MDESTFVFLIPFGISLIGGIITFFVTLAIYKEKVKTLKEDVREIKDELKEIRDKVIACETSLKEREPFVKRERPKSLTVRGVELL